MTAVIVMLGVITALGVWTAVASARLRHEVRRHLRAPDGHDMRHLKGTGVDHFAAPVFPWSLEQDGRRPSVWRPGSPLTRLNRER